MVQQTQRMASSQGSLQTSTYFTNLHSRSPCVLLTCPTCSNRTPVSAPCINHVFFSKRYHVEHRLPGSLLTHSACLLIITILFTRSRHRATSGTLDAGQGLKLYAKLSASWRCQKYMLFLALLRRYQKISEAVHCIRRSGRRMENLHGEEIYRVVKRKRRSIYGHPDLHKRTLFILLRERR